MEDIKVSIVCNAYNHENYIGDALESFVKQKTNFQYEILVHDDASTDRTAEIIKNYVAKYPELIKPIYEETNQYSISHDLVAKIQAARVKGKYIALCEGDDYWIDSYKLQKQYDLLEKNLEVDICATAAVVVDAGTKKEIARKEPFKENQVIPVQDVIKGGGGYVATNSLMYRTYLENNMPVFRKKWDYDYALQIHGSLRGGMLYLSDCTAAYRWMAKGSWSQKTYSNRETYIKSINNFNDMLTTLNQETDGKYSDAINDTVTQNEFVILRLTGDLKKMKSIKYRTLYDKLEVKDKIKMHLKMYFPFLMRSKLR